MFVLGLLTCILKMSLNGFSNSALLGDFPRAHSRCALPVHTSLKDRRATSQWKPEGRPSPAPTSEYPVLPSPCLQEPRGPVLCGAHAAALAFEGLPRSPERVFHKEVSRGAGLDLHCRFHWQLSHQWEAPGARKLGTGLGFEW